MFEDKMFKYRDEYLSDDFFEYMDKKLHELAKDKDHRKSEDPYHVGNILLCLEFVELSNCVSYLLNKYGAEFIGFVQNHFILNESDCEED